MYVYIYIYAGIDDSLIERDLYKDLGLTSTASFKEIKKAFRSLAQVHHPDKSNVEYMYRCIKILTY
jgi:DnaJ-domain-containing protein 1